MRPYLKYWLIIFQFLKMLANILKFYLILPLFVIYISQQLRFQNLSFFPTHIHSNAISLCVQKRSSALYNFHILGARIVLIWRARMNKN
jgi:hypothetical protein